MTSAARRLPALIAVLALALAVLATGPAPVAAAAAPQWADASTATIHPGVQMFTDGAQCTANFVFYSTDARTGELDDVLIGYAAHCAGTGAQTDTNGCTTASLAIGTPVEISGATQPGSLAYSSWKAMQDADEPDQNACRGNDFALVRVAQADWGRVNPTIPFWGGPQQIDTDGISLGERVFSYGNSSLRPRDSVLSHKEGYGVQTTSGGWLHTLYTTSPGIPGDSGSAFVDGDGRALGVVSTLALAPLAGSNNITDINLALDYARSHGTGFADLQLADGTLPFDPGLGTPVG